jgi:hypothetical protein
MGVEIIGLIAGLLALIPVVYSAMQKRKANRNDLGKVESAEMGAAMDRADAAPRVQPVPRQGQPVYVRRKPPV